MERSAGDGSAVGEGVLRALVESAWMKFIDAGADDPHDWLAKIDALVQSGAYLNDYDVRRLIEVEPRRAAEVAEHVVSDLRVPIGERVHVARRMRAHALDFSNDEDPDAGELRWSVAEALLHPPGSNEREYVAAGVRTRALQASLSDSDGAVLALQVLAQSEAAHGRAAHERDPMLVPGHADPRTLLVLALVEQERGNREVAEQLAFEALGRADRAEEWEDEPARSATVLCWALGMLGDRVAGVLAPVPDEHPARRAWRSATSATFMRDAEQVELALEEGRSVLAAHVDDQAIETAWLTSLFHGSSLVDGTSTGDRILWALAEARLRAADVPTDPDVALAFVCPVADAARTAVERDALVMQELATAACWLDLDVDLGKMDHLGTLVAAEIERVGIDAFGERLRCTIPEDPVECGIGWNVVRAMTSAIGATGTETPAMRASLIQDAADRWGAACLHGLPVAHVFGAWFDQIAPEERRTDVLRQVVAEVPGIGPHVVAELDAAILDAPDPDWRAPLAQHLPGSAFLLREARWDVVRSPRGAEPSWEALDGAVDGLQRHGSLLTERSLHEMGAPDLLPDIAHQAGLVRRLNELFVAGALSPEEAAVSLRSGEAALPSAPWVLGRCVKGSIEEVVLDAEAISTLGSSTGVARQDMDAALDAFVVGLTAPSTQDLSAAAPGRRTGVDELDDGLGEASGASRYAIGADGDFGQASREPEQLRGPDDGARDLGLDDF